MAKETTEKKLYDLLTTRNFDNFQALDSKTNKPPIDPETGAEDISAADMFTFDWTATDGDNYGTVVVLVTSDGSINVYYGDNLGRGMEQQDKTEWFDFLGQLKDFATKNLKNFSPENMNRLRYSLQGQAAIKEGLFESWSGTKTQSWNGKQTEARLMIKHKKALDENDARYRYISALFVETAEGERYKLPFTKLVGGRAMLEHVRQGGRPYDIRGQHIAEMVNELNVLSRFKRANQGKLFEGDTAQLVEEVSQYYQNLQHSLKGLGGSKGYTKYFESWNPSEISEQDVVIESLKHLFVTQSIDTRVEQALPLLAKIQQQGKAMKEANIFEAWANQLMEGTWALPDTPEQQQKLVELLSKEFPVGADATNATEQLYDLLGDDELYDELERLADQNPDADCRQLVYDRMQMLSDHPSVQKVIDQVQIEPEAEMNPAPEVNPADVAPPPVAESTCPKCHCDPCTCSDHMEESVSMNAIRRFAGLKMLNESVLNDSANGTLEHILNRFRHEVRNFEQGGDLDKDLYDALFDYYMHTGDMPYGVQKARTGDPMEWVAQNLESHLHGRGIVGGNPDEDYGLERESMGDYEAESDVHSVDGGMENPLVMGEEAMCNMTEAGCACPVHGMEECYATTATPPLEEAQADPMMSRIKTLAGFLIK